MNILRHKICSGVGDLLHAKAYYDTLKHEWDEIHLRAFRRMCNGKFRPIEPVFPNFITELCELLWIYDKNIFWHPVHDKETGGPLDENQFPNLRDYHSQDVSQAWPLVIPQLAKILSKGKPLDIGKYVVVTTKARAIESHSYQKHKKQIWGYIKKLAEESNTKIVIIGDQYIVQNFEENMHGTFCVYEDIIKYLGNENTVDLSTPRYLSTEPDLKILQQDCLYMAEAQGTICVGLGGNLALAIASETYCRTLFTWNQGNMLKYMQSGQVDDPNGQMCFAQANVPLFLQSLPPLFNREKSN